jgi:hypothetical protein
MTLPLKKPSQLAQTNLLNQTKTNDQANNTNGEAETNFGVRLYDPSTVQDDAIDQQDDHNMLWADERRTRMIHLIRSTVKDQRCGEWLMSRVVDDVIEGTIDGSEVKVLLSFMDSKSDIRNRGAYFNSSVRRIYREAGVPL